jgi:hypothetical protein
MFLANKQVSGEKYVGKYVLTFIAMNHSWQFVHIFHTNLSESMLHQFECNEVVDLVDCCRKIYLVVTSDNSERLTWQTQGFWTKLLNDRIKLV